MTRPRKVTLTIPRIAVQVDHAAVRRVLRNRRTSTVLREICDTLAHLVDVGAIEVQARRTTKRPRVPASIDPEDPRLEGFAEFWRLYPPGPRKIKKPAMEQWIEQECAPHTSAIVSRVRYQKLQRDWRKEQGRFVPAPVNFLKARQWEDYNDEIVSPNRSALDTYRASRAEAHPSDRRGRSGHAPDG